MKNEVALAGYEALLRNMKNEKMRFASCKAQALCFILA
jgi:hypothetical protein